MKSLKFFFFLFLSLFCFSVLTAAPKTIDEINEEREKQEIEKKIAKENEKKAVEENCQNNSSTDCFTYAQRFAKDDEEKLVYFGKACELQYQPGCDEADKIKAAIEAEKARIAAEEKRKAEEEQERLRKEAEAEKERQRKEAEAEKERQRKEAEAEKERLKKEREANFKKELNQAGKKKRIAIATGILVPGVVLLGGAAFSFYEMSDSRKWHDKYYQKYLAATDTSTADKYRKKTKKARDDVQLFKILGSVGIGVGAAMVATGIAFYSIEFEGEKAVKKKYNVSFGASPFDGTLQFALRW